MHASSNHLFEPGRIQDPVCCAIVWVVSAGKQPAEFEMREDRPGKGTKAVMFAGPVSSGPQPLLFIERHLDIEQDILPAWVSLCRL